MKKDTKSYSSSLAGGEAAILNNPGVLTTYFGTPRPRNNKAGLTLPAPRESGSPPDSFSSGGPVSFCTCNQLIAYDTTYSKITPDSDPQEYYWQCPKHQKGKEAPWLINTLSWLIQNKHLLTKFGLDMLHKLTGFSDKRNPYLPQIAIIDAELDKIKKDIEWAKFAKEKLEEWNQKDQESRASKGKRIPLPQWLNRYDAAKTKKLLDKEYTLSNQKWHLLQQANNFRHHDNYNYNNGGN